MSDLDSRKILRELGLRPSKGLGQNFLVDESVPPKILSAANLQPSDKIVEIGPGVGVLTLRLAPLVERLTAVELDRRLYPYLHEKLSPYKGARLVEGDALDFLPRILEPEPYKLIANIPYYITSAILRHFLESDHPPTRLVLMLQKEVAERIVATPPDMSLLALSVQFYGRPNIWSYVEAAAFFPVPKVDSAILVIETFPKDAHPYPHVEAQPFFDLVRAGFGQKRKQLGNSLANGLKIEKSQLLDQLAQINIQATRRAESLSLAEWVKLYELFSRANNG